MSELCALRQRVCVTSCRRDEAWGDWLARALEAWRIGKDLVGRWTPAEDRCRPRSRRSAATASEALPATRSASKRWRRCANHNS